MLKFAVRNWVPCWVRGPLWGDRQRWGLEVNQMDQDWHTYQETMPRFYAETQRGLIGRIISDAGYRVMSAIDLSGKIVLEIGPGDIRHVAFWRGNPNEYILADVQPDMLAKGEDRLAEAQVQCRSMLMNREESLPLADASVDVVVSFYSLEHIYPLEPYLSEIKRVLRPGGILIGGIPTEGGLAWGLGRLLTSRRWFKRHTSIDPDKIICWEHPNFGDQLVAEFDRHFSRRKLYFWPFSWVPMLDPNLVIRFIYVKQD